MGSRSEVRKHDAADSNTAWIYAQRLAYLGCPAKIRAHTMREFGRAPSLDDCKRFIEQHRAHKPDYLHRQRGTKPPKTPEGVEWEALQSPLGDHRRPVDLKRPQGTHVLAPKPEPEQPKPAAAPLVQAEPVAAFVVPRTVRWMIHVAAQIFEVSDAEIIGPARHRAVLLARQAIYLVAIEAGRWSTPQIGRVIGGRDHSTILHGRITATERAKRDPAYSSQIDQLRRAVAEAFGDAA